MSDAIIVVTGELMNVSVCASSWQRQALSLATGMSDMKFIFRSLTLIAALIGGIGANAASPLASEMKVSGGAVRTDSRNAQGVLSFKGIPYAAAPIGDLRWRSPAPAPAWPAVRDATSYGAACIQGAPAAMPKSEDCLTINVWTAARFTSERRPVMVWIYGGGFQGGSATESGTDGEQLAAKGVVLVSFNYRTGVFGFLSHPDLDREGTPSGDFGLQDQIAALKWVRADIGRFGGDPANVTIFGESAGAMSVGLLMSSPKAEGLFHKAIEESGAFWDSEHGSIPTRTEAQTRGMALADRLAHGSVAELRSIPAETLSRETAWNGMGDPLIQSFSPSIDGYVLPDSPANRFAHRQQTAVPLLAGWNGSEGFVFAKMSHLAPSAEQFGIFAADFFGQARMADFLNVYPSSTNEQAATSAVALIGDLFIVEQTWESLQLQSRKTRSPVYSYNFTYLSPYTPIAAHTSEIDYVFNTLAPHWLVPGKEKAGARDRELADQVSSYWVNFARNGNPNGLGLPTWPVYRADAPQVMMFDTVTAAAPERGAERMRFIQSFRTDGRFPESWRAKP